MIFFVTFLRALAACLITNAHYTGIYPSDLIANGGLIGDVIFFAVSGYCLSNIKTPFFSWYGKRLFKIYPPVIVATIVYLLCGAYVFADHNFLWWFIYPTYYHFVASILVLYIPFYFCMKYNVLKRNLVFIMLGVFLVAIMVYFFVYDSSYYHIDTVREPMIRFLFFESMLLGAWFRAHDNRFRDRFRKRHFAGLVVSFSLYFGSKMMFAKIDRIAPFQIVNQLLIFLLLYFILLTASGLDSSLNGLPAWVKKAISEIANLTLEIYVVQYVLIDLIRPIGRFPLNWFVLTASIVISAWVLKKAVATITMCIQKTTKIGVNPQRK